MAHKRDYKPEDIAFPNQAITESELVSEMQTSYIDYAIGPFHIIFLILPWSDIIGNRSRWHIECNIQSRFRNNCPSPY